MNKQIFKIENGRFVFNTIEDAHDYFIETEGCESDDMDKEEVRFEKWLEDNNIKIRE